MNNHEISLFLGQIHHKARFSGINGSVPQTLNVFGKKYEKIMEIPHETVKGKPYLEILYQMP